MKNLRSLNLNRIYFILLAFMVISFTLPAAYNSIAIILLPVALLSNYKNLKSNFKSYSNNKSNLLLIAIFACLSISMLYSEDKHTGLKTILTALPLITIPLSLTGFTTSSEKKIHFLKKIFVFACLISSLIYLFLAINRSGMLDGSYKLVHAPENFYAYFVDQLTYNRLSPSIHAIFYSLYIALAILIIIFEFKNNSLQQRLLYGILVLYFLIYLLLLISITINFALYSFLILYFFLKSSFKKWWHYLVFFGGIAIGTATTVYLITIKYLGPYGDGTYRFDSPPVNKRILLTFIAAFIIGAVAIIIKLIFRKRYIYLLPAIFLLSAVVSFIYLGNNNSKVNDLKENNISVRFKYGKAAIDVIKANPFLGIGIGDKKNKWIMKTEDLPPGATPEHVFNSHNQFLDFWVAAGILPLICFSFFLYREFRKSLRQNHIVYTGLVYCFCLFCFTDSAMMVQRGQVFFLFFIWLFDVESQKRMEENKIISENAV